MVDDGGAVRRTGRRGLWIAAGIAAAGAVAAVVGVFVLPGWMYSDQAARASLQGGLLTAAAALTAVAGALIALDETRQANAEVRRANVEIRRANDNTHVRELYTRAVDQLGSETVTIRLGGIYALGRIAMDSPADQRAVLEVLSAFVRVRSTALGQRTSARLATDGEPSRPVYPAADIRAAVQVLARLPDHGGRRTIDLLGGDLTGPASLAQLDLKDAHLRGLRTRKADLYNASLIDADLRGAYLFQADLRSALLARANLSHARLHGADLTGADLEGADLTEAEGVSQEQLDTAHGDEETRLPEGLTRPAHWPKEPAAGS